MTPLVPSKAPDGLLSALPLDCVIHGDCLDVLRGLPDACVDAVVTDPPYGLGAAPDMLEVLQAWLMGDAYTSRGKGGFMGKAWDAFVPGPEYWREVLRVLKPGGHALVFAGTRTWDVMGLALRLAGFEIRDTCQWVYGSGFPKSLDVGKAIDKAAGAQREVVGERWRRASNAVYGNGKGTNTVTLETRAATDAAQAWDGWGTALKPAWEPIIVCRKPLGASTVAANVLAHGTGALNIAASRVGSEATLRTAGVTPSQRNSYGTYAADMGEGRQTFGSTAGRWPANLLLSHSIWCAPDVCVEGCPVRELDAQSGVSRSSVTHGVKRSNGVLKYAGTNARPSHGVYQRETDSEGFNDTGGASRYFPTFRYQAKASRAERNRGCEELNIKAVHRYGAGLGQGQHPEAPVIERNSHPTVKPLALMSWLITLITPAGGVVLDPFTGSGSTLCAAKAGGWRYVGIEREAEYVAIAQARLNATQEPRGPSLGSAVALAQPKPVKPTRKPRKAPPVEPLWEIRA